MYSPHVAVQAENLFSGITNHGEFAVLLIVVSVGHVEGSHAVFGQIGQEDVPSLVKESFLYFDAVLQIR
jgi:hypothetical protein